ncbi:MAG: signal peptidase I [Dactylosporangium sp.]|nr:signal peptidase I [Dactylosporangium sp.]NNJ63744.1 signal peptidase I [Dactylosporangium sp.]
MIDEQTKRRSTFWREFPVLLAVAIVVAVVVRAFVMQTFFIPSESMQRTLNINDRVLVNKLVYDFRQPRRGEVIVFKAPAMWSADPAEKDFIKRVIGIGGDHIVCCDAQQRITVNGHALDEEYIFHDDEGVADLASDDPFDVTIPAKRLWVMGDHRSQSGDSRQQYLRTHDVVDSTITEDTVIGRAFVVFWPIGGAKWLDVPKTFEKVPAPPKT